MRLRFSSIPAIVAGVMVFFAAAPTRADVTVYESAAAFNLAVNPGTLGVDPFNGFSTTGVTTSPITRITSIGASWTYTASAVNNFFGAGTVANPWLSPNTATDPMNFGSFSGTPNAIGGNIFGSDINGAFLSGSIRVTVVDQSGPHVFDFAAPNSDTFRGFISDGTITSMSVASIQPGAGFLWPTVDNLQFAVAPIPEPSFVLGLAVLFGLARRYSPKS